MTEDEYDWMYNYLYDVRSFTLIPLDALQAALSAFGHNEQSSALVTALGLPRPGDWSESEEDDDCSGSGDGGGDGSGDGGGEGDGEGDGDGGGNGGGDGTGSDEGGDGEGGGDDGSDGSVAGTEVADDEPPVADEPQDAMPPDVGDAGPGVEAAQTKPQRGLDASPLLEAEFRVFEAYRTTPLNPQRSGIAVMAVTCSSDRVRVQRFLVWLETTYRLKSSPTLAVFLNDNIGRAATRYVEELVASDHKYSYCSKIAASLVAVASFVVSRRGGGTMALSLTQLTALHSQCRQQARQQDKFDVAEKPESWLDWQSIQRVRVSAEKALSTAKSDAEKLKFTCDVAVLRLLADQPPDRVVRNVAPERAPDQDSPPCHTNCSHTTPFRLVPLQGVVRTLKLGGTLKRKANGAYMLDLSEPGLHKTSSVFGATRTTINESIAPFLDRYCERAGIQEGGFLFHAKGNQFEVVAPSTWTKRVKSIFNRHGDVPLCPKDARSSFITFLRSGEHDDETVKAAAVAMRHSSRSLPTECDDALSLHLSAASNVWQARRKQAPHMTRMPATNASPPPCEWPPNTRPSSLPSDLPTADKHNAVRMALWWGGGGHACLQERR